MLPASAVQISSIADELAMAPSSKPPRVQAASRCPICGAPTEPGFRPFCSWRCADVDLSRWLRGGYAIPVAEDDDEDGDRMGGGSSTDDDPNQGHSGGGAVH